MNLETLANELLLDLLEYFHIAHLFQAFYNLNNRFNKLLLVYFQTHGHLNFDSISKTNFDIVCQQYLPIILDHVHSIHLSDDNETVQQTTLFFSFGYQLRQFTHLKTLSLSHIYSEEIIKNIVAQLHQLDHLTYVKIINCRIDHDLINDGWIFDQFWSLEKLIHCHLERKKYLWDPFFISPKLISSSIRYLYLRGFSYDSNQFHHLFEHTVNLETLNIALDHNYDYQQVPLVITSMKKLNISIEYSPYVTNNLLRYMPYLTSLTIELVHFFLDGYQWEEKLTNYLPRLKSFHLKIEFSRQRTDRINEEINQTLDSFRSPFWITIHQWYIQCHWYLLTYCYKIHLYTIPYNFNEFLIKSDIEFQSTYPNNDIQRSYDNVHKLSFHDVHGYSIRFNNVKYLKTYLPVTDCFWSIVPNLNRLISLNVELFDHTSSIIQLENLLESATGLYSLTLTVCPLSFEFLFHLKSFSIRRLCLYGIGCFNNEQCRHFIRSPLGIQCEILFIQVKHRTDIVEIIDGMKNLRILNVRSQDAEDKLVDFLKTYLSKKCIIARGKNSGVTGVQLWIRQ